MKHLVIALLCLALLVGCKGSGGGDRVELLNASYDTTRGSTAQLIKTFDANHQCREVACLYNHANWWIEDLIENPGKLDRLEAKAMDAEDYFL